MFPACARKDLFDSFSRMLNREAGNMRNFAVSDRKNWGYCVLTFPPFSYFPKNSHFLEFPNSL